MKDSNLCVRTQIKKINDGKKCPELKQTNSTSELFGTGWSISGAFVTHLDSDNTLQMGHHYFDVFGSWTRRRGIPYDFHLYKLLLRTRCAVLEKCATDTVADILYNSPKPLFICGWVISRLDGPFGGHGGMWVMHSFFKRKRYPISSLFTLAVEDSSLGCLIEAQERNGERNERPKARCSWAVAIIDPPGNHSTPCWFWMLDPLLAWPYDRKFPPPLHVFDEKRVLWHSPRHELDQPRSGFVGRGPPLNSRSRVGLLNHGEEVMVKIYTLGQAVFFSRVGGYFLDAVHWLLSLTHETNSPEGITSILLHSPPIPYLKVLP